MEAIKVILKQKTTWFGIISIISVVGMMTGTINTEVAVSIIGSLWGVDNISVRKD